MRKVLIILFGFFFIFCSCRNNNELAVEDYTRSKVFKANGYVVPKDSMSVPKVNLVDETKLKKIRVGNPIILHTNTNIQPSGTPKIVISGNPKIVTPGQDSFLLPKSFMVSDSPFIGGMPEIVKAKDPSMRDQNPQTFTIFNNLQGLKHSIIICMLQDKSGNLWFGTGGGASKYDGKSFSHFTEKEGLSNNWVYGIVEDRMGNLWFGTYGGGVSKFDGKYFTHFTEKNGLPNNYVRSIIEDHFGNIWIGTDGGGVCKYDGKSFTYFTEKEGLSSNYVISILEDHLGNLWFGTENNGVNKYDGKSFSHFTYKEGLAHNSVLCISEDRLGNLWFGSGREGGGASKYDGRTFTRFSEKEGLPNNVVWKIVEDKSGNIWFATSEGACKYDGKYFSRYTDKEGLSNNRVYSILEDKSGNLWFGSGGGINKFQGNSFTHYTEKEGLSNNVVNSILEDKSGNLWFGTYGGGVNKYDGKSFTHFTTKEGLFNDNVLSILEDKSGNFWFGVDGGGVVKFDGKYFTHYTGRDGFSSYVVNSSLLDRSGNLWFGTQGDGASKYDGKSFTHFTIKEGLSNNDVTSIIEDHIGNIWFGTYGGGLCKYDGKSFTHFTAKQGLSSNNINCILEDKSGNIWVGTDGDGISKYDGKSITHFTTKEGLSSNNVNSILEDKSGNIWFGTRSGLNKLSKAALPEFSNKAKSDGTTKTNIIFKTYNYKDGFLGISCKITSIEEDKKGNIWIGTSDRLTVYNPEGETSDSIAPAVYITAIDLFNESIAWRSLENKKDSIFILDNGVRVGNFKFDSITKWYGLPTHLSLAYNNNNLTFNFVGISQKNPENVKYKYRLDGNDENWSAVTSNNQANYGNLSSGNYTFKVIAMNGEGYWGKELNYSFVIRPPWWKTWWAYVLYIVVFVVGIRSFIIYRSRRLKEENILLEEKVSNRTAQLNQSLEELKSTQSQLIQSEKMASLGELTAGIAHEIQNPLNFVNNFSEVSTELVDEMNVEIEKGNTGDAKLIALDLKQNLEKISHHGKRAGDIVKSMLQHSRSSSATKEPADINKLADEYLRLAYHGLRAKDKSFNATMKTDFDESIGNINIISQDIGRVILNLITNAFYAVKEKQKQVDGNYEPTVTVSTKKQNGKIQIRVRDNGDGIPQKVVDKIFQPFFTTKPTGKGTGLGLSLAYDIVTKGHGGELKVETKEGEGAEFLIILNA